MSFFIYILLFCRGRIAYFIPSVGDALILFLFFYLYNYTHTFIRLPVGFTCLFVYLHWGHVSHLLQQGVSRWLRWHPLPGHRRWVGLAVSQLGVVQGLLGVGAPPPPPPTSTALAPPIPACLSIAIASARPPPPPTFWAGGTRPLSCAQFSP